MTRGRKTKRRLTRLGRYLRDNDIGPNELADMTGVSRQHLCRLRYGRSEPTRPLMIWLTVGCQRMLALRGGRHSRRVRITDLFDLGDSKQ